MTFEKVLRERTLPQVVPSIPPAYEAGFEIGAAIGRNRAMNFKILFVDAYLGSMLREFGALLRMRLRRAQGRTIRWGGVGEVLQDAMKRGGAARRQVLAKFGRLPTKYAEDDPRVLRLLPSAWVPDCSLPVATGVGKGFFPSLWRQWRRDRRKVYVRPKFETWDMTDVPPFILDAAKEFGVEQASLVASSLGDSMGRGLGRLMGGQVGFIWGLGAALRQMLHDRKPLDDNNVRSQLVGGGYLKDAKEMQMLTEYLD